MQQTKKRMVFKKPDWGPPPPGYIAGLGRGATGFITRGDVGTARIGEQTFSDARTGRTIAGPPGVLPGMGRGQGRVAVPPGLGAKVQRTQQGELPSNDAHFDKWNGFDKAGNLFEGRAAADAVNPSEQDEVDIDQQLDKIDQYMDGRWTKKREQKFQEKLLEQKQEKLDKYDFTKMFTSEKEQIKDMSQDQWESLPDGINLVKTSRAKRNQEYKRYTPVPDSILQSASLDAQGAQYSTTAAAIDGTESTMLDSEGQIDTELLKQQLLDQAEMSQAKNQVMSLQLDKAAGTSQAAASVNKEGYLTDLGSIKVKTDAEVSDLKKARALLKSVILSDPNGASGWIAAARVEELDMKFEEANRIIGKACQKFQTNEDIWLEAARLAPSEQSETVLKRAIQLMPKSKKLWLQAFKRASDSDPLLSKKKKQEILAQARRHLPNEIELWTEAVKLEEEVEGKKTLLGDAIAVNPQCTELYLSLAKLEEDFEASKGVLNQAITNIPSDYIIWIAAAQLQEESGQEKDCISMVKRALKRLTKAKVLITREQWLEEALKCEQRGRNITAKAILEETINFGLDSNLAHLGGDEKAIGKEKRRIWVEEMATLKQKGGLLCARSLISCSTKQFPAKKKLWQAWIELEQQSGSAEQVEAVLSLACEAVGPEKNTVFILRYSKHVWKKQNDLSKALAFLSKAQSRQPESPHLLLALQKLLRESGNLEEAAKIVEQWQITYGKDSPNERVSMQEVQISRQAGDNRKATELVEGALKLFSSSPKLHIIRAQILEEDGAASQEEVRSAYDKALHDPALRKSALLWICASQFEQRIGAYTKARSLLQKARVKLTTNDDDAIRIWIESILLEVASDNSKIALNLSSQALQKFPTCGQLVALSVSLEPLTTRKTKVREALKKIEDSCWIFLEGARQLWSENKPEKAIKFVRQAIHLDKDNGDAWGLFMKYTLEKPGTSAAEVESVKKEFEENDPCHGYLWPSLNKAVANWSKPKGELLVELSNQM